MKTFSRNAILSFSRMFSVRILTISQVVIGWIFDDFPVKASVAWRSGGVASVRWRAQKGLEDSRKINGTLPRGGSSSRRAENIYWKTSQHSSKLMTFPFSYSFTFFSSSHLSRTSSATLFSAIPPEAMIIAWTAKHTAAAAEWNRRKRMENLSELFMLKKVITKIIIHSWIHRAAVVGWSGEVEE